MAFLLQYEFPIVGPYSGPGLISADSDLCLSDRSLATKAVVSNYIGPSGVIINAVEGALAEPPEAPGSALLVTSASPVWARFEADAEIQNVVMETIGTGSQSGLDFSAAPVTTAKYTYYRMDSTAWGRVHDIPHTVARVQVPIDRVDPSHQTTVYEAWIVVGLVVPDAAPPCRIFPREDGLGVGAGRNYPPAKSQQRSSRGVGFY